jgi:hypothetical protein
MSEVVKSDLADSSFGAGTATARPASANAATRLTWPCRNFTGILLGPLADRRSSAAQDPQPGVHVAGENRPPSTTTDSVLPSENLRIDDAAVFWPLSDDALFRLVGTFPFPSSDHRLVWVDVRTRGGGS